MNSGIRAGNILWHVTRTLLFQLPAERSHRIAIGAMGRLSKNNALARFTRSACRLDDDRLKVLRFGYRLDNPLGLAAGFDKNGDLISAMPSFGFGWVEVGTVTPEEQPGNPSPRLFRLPRERALINRFGFNSLGAVKVAENIAKADPVGLLGVNIGRMRCTENKDAATDYIRSIDHLYGLASYIVLNLSSPNTSGLRNLQEPTFLRELLQRVVEHCSSLARSNGRQVPLLVKLSPDLSNDDLVGAAATCFREGIAGIVATNTTTSKSSLKFANSDPKTTVEAGGISGLPLTKRTLEVVRLLYREFDGKMPIIGVGGVMSGEDMWNLMCAGASLVQTYTGFVYGGPLFARNSLKYVVERLRREDIAHVDQIIGRDHRSTNATM
jgi:dihydroorotate dehydrogenase